MSPKKIEKYTLHPKNKHKGRYNLTELIEALPELKAFIITNKYGDETIQFSDPKAVKALNKALLFKYYNLKYWDVPDNYLCPPIPGRADYIHHIAELLGKKNNYKIPMNNKVTCLDIGTGANCIYPIIGSQAYGWKFIGSEIDEVAIKSAEKIISNNDVLQDKIDLRFQKNDHSIFKSIIKKNDKIDIVICNPPFHKSAQEAEKGNQRKNKNLGLKTKDLNFGGTNKELWCAGGEKQFILSMIKESVLYGQQCYWFSTLVSKKDNLKAFYSTLKSNNAVTIKTINMGQGQKSSRIVAWTFLDNDAQEDWMHNKWRAWTTED